MSASVVAAALMSAALLVHGAFLGRGADVLSAVRPARRTARSKLLRDCRLLAGELAASRRLCLAAFVAAALTTTVAVVAGILAACGIAAVATALLWSAVAQRHEQRAELRARAWQEALARFASALATGIPLSDALRAGADAAGAGDHHDTGVPRRLRVAAAYLDAGGNPAAGFALEHASPPDQTARRLAACFDLCTVLGLAPSAVLKELAAAEAAGEQARRDTRVALATARATSRLLAGLPLGGVLLGSAFGVSALSVLFTTTSGQLCVLAAGLLEATGLVWVQRIARLRETR